MNFRLLVVPLALLVTTDALSPFSRPTPERKSATSTTRLLAFAPQPADTDTASKNDMYKDVKGIIFDVDGTLADSWKLGFDATQAILERHGIPVIDEESYHYGTRWSTPERLARHAGLEPGDDDFESVGAKLGREFDEHYVALVSLETACFYNGVTSLLQGIPSNIALGALTNAAVRYADAVLEVNCPVLSKKQEVGGIHCRFKSIKGADNVPEPKPSPAGLFVVCDELGLDPKDCVYIGDSPTDGMSAAAAGMPAIGVLWGSHREETLRKAPFAHICRTIEELQELLPSQ